MGIIGKVKQNLKYLQATLQESPRAKEKLIAKAAKLNALLFKILGEERLRQDKQGFFIISKKAKTEKLTLKQK